MNIFNNLYRLGPRQIIIRLLAGVLLLGLLIWLWGYLSSGEVTIKTDSPDRVVTIEHLDSGDLAFEDRVIESANGSLNTRVKSGTYRIRAGDKKNFTTRIIVVKARSSSEYVLNPKPVPTTEPVSPIDGDNYTITQSGIRYLSGSGYIQQIGAAGLSEPKTNVRLENFAWGGGGYGIGYDGLGRLYSIDKNGTKPLDTPRRIQSEPEVSPLAVAVNNRSFVAIGQDIYTMVPGEPLRKIHTTTAHAPALFASKTKVFVASSPIHGPEAEGEDAHTEEPTVEIIDVTGEVLATKNMSSADVWWSPDENNVLVKSFTGEVKIYDINLNPVRDVPDSNIVDVVWQDDSSLYYIASNQVLFYNFSEETTSPVVLWNPNNTLSSLALDKSRGYLYFANKRDGKLSIKKAGLEGQESFPDAQALDIILPKAVGQCYFSYINLARPTILVNYPGSGGKGRQDSCLSAAELELAHFHLDPAKFVYKAIPFNEGH